MHLGFFVHPHAVHQLDAFQLLGAVSRWIEVLLRHDRRLLDETVFDGARQRIVHHHVLERNRPLGGLGERCRRQLQAEHWLQLIQRPYAGAGPVAVRLVHQQHQVRQPRKIVEVALTQIFRQAFDARCLAAAHLGVDLRDVEDVDLHRRINGLRHQVATLLVRFSGDHLGRGGGELGNALEHVLRRVGREVADQFVVNGQVGCQHEEVLVAIGRIQVADERTHQPRLANARGQREAQGREVALEVRKLREHGLQRLDHGSQLFR